MGIPQGNADVAEGRHHTLQIVSELREADRLLESSHGIAEVEKQLDTTERVFHCLAQPVRWFEDRRGRGIVQAA